MLREEIKAQLVCDLFFPCVAVEALFYWIFVMNRFTFDMEIVGVLNFFWELYCIGTFHIS